MRFSIYTEFFVTDALLGIESVKLIKWSSESFPDQCVAGNLDLVHCTSLKLLLLLYFVFSNSLVNMKHISYRASSQLFTSLGSYLIFRLLLIDFH